MSVTDREVEVLRLVACGLSNRQVADELVNSRRTAEHHVQNAYGRHLARAAAAQSPRWSTTCCRPERRQ